MANVIAPSDGDDQPGLADWIEATMLAEGTTYLPRARIRKYLRSLLAGEDPEIPVDVTLREIERRRRLCKSAYPFSEDRSGVKFVAATTAVPYLFMLCTSASKPFRDERRYADADALFDSLVVDALKNYLGRGARAVRFGSPASGSRPPSFKESIAWLARELGLPSGGGRPRPHVGDGGLDVIAWRPFADKRSAFIAILAQCTVQRDWEIKAKDLGEDIWRGWIDFGKSPHLLLAIPFVVSPTHPRWDEVRRMVHTILDRLRIVELTSASKVTQYSEIQTWVAAEVQRMSGG